MSWQPSVPGTGPSGWRRRLGSAAALAAVGVLLTLPDARPAGHAAFRRVR